MLRLEISHPRIKVQEPGQYCFVRVAQLGHWQWHPFSVATTPQYAADAATADGGESRYRFVIYVRDFGDWSSELVRQGPELLAPSPSAAGQGQRAVVGLDGMYGRIAVPFETYAAVVLVAGGIGCTPMFAVLMHLAETAASNSSSSSNSRPLKNGRAVTFVWTFRELELLPAFARELRAARALGWGLRLHHTTAKLQPSTAGGGDDAENGAGERSSCYSNAHGYCVQQLPENVPLDIAEMVRPGRPVLQDVYSKVRVPQPHQPGWGGDRGCCCGGAGDGSSSTACAVLACGPMGLVQSAKQACTRGNAGMHFEFHSEEFEW